MPEEAQEAGIGLEPDSSATCIASSRNIQSRRAAETSHVRSPAGLADLLQQERLDDPRGDAGLRNSGNHLRAMKISGAFAAHVTPALEGR